MTRDEAAAILRMDEEKAVEKILELAGKAEKYDQLCGQVEPATPSGMTPVYLKPKGKKRKKRPGRKKGHKGESRKIPTRIDEYKEHTLDCCPNCQNHLDKSTDHYKRYTEDIPEVEATVTEHTIYRYWCPTCKKIIAPVVTDAMPNAVLGIRLVVFTAWLHYLIGISVNNLTKMVNIFANFKVSAGGLTQAWKNLALRLEGDYNEIRRKIYHCAVLHADETGWRINGDTFWLWCFATKEACYYIITKSRGSPVIEDFLGIFFNGILICDFWPAYNMISALAKQRCFYHLFTELVKVDKYNPSTEWKSFRKKLSRLLKDALRLSERRAHKNVDVYEGLKGKLHARLNSLLSEEYQDRDVKRIIKRLKRHKDEMFTFLDYEGVSPYNNYAEQQMRNAVIVRKISQQNRSLKGARTQSILMSLFRTAQLRGENPVEYVLALVKIAIQVAAYQKEQRKAAA